MGDALTRLARSLELTPELQVYLWGRGDPAVRVAVAGRADLPEALEAVVVRCADDAVLAAWASAPGRKADLLARVVAGTCDPVVLRNVAGQDALDTATTEALLARGVGTVSERLLRRGSLSSAQRVRAVRAFLRDAPPAAGSVPRTLADTIGTDPDVLDCAITAYPLRHTALLSCVRPDSPEDVTDAIVTALEAAAGGPAVESSHASATHARDLNNAVRALIALPQLPLGQCVRVAAVAVAADLPVADQARRRSVVDVDALLRSVNAHAGDPCPSGERHVAAVQLLLEVHPFVTLPASALAWEALVHAEQLGSDQVVQAFRRVAASDLGALVAQVELTYGSRSPLLASAVAAAGVHTAASLTDPLPVLVELAGRGSAPLQTSSRVPEATRSAVARSFRPVSGVLGDALYAREVAAVVGALPEPDLDVVVSLLQEWHGSLDELLAAARILGRNEH